MAKSPDGRMNFLLGYGERLVEPLDAPSSVPNKRHPYTLSEAAARLQEPAFQVTRGLDALPALACPDDKAVALFTLHPSYLAKSYFPRHLMEAVGFEVVGTRSRTIVPATSVRAERQGQPQVATELYVAGGRQAFRDFADTMAMWPEAAARVQRERADRGRISREALRTERVAEDLVKLEGLRVQPPGERLRSFASKSDVTTIEVVLHARNDAVDVLEGFAAFARTFDLRVDLSARLHAEGLCFFALRASREQAKELAAFSFLRVVREMPGLRQLNPELRVPGGKTPVPTELPDAPALDSTVRVAVFDGGLPAHHPLGRWVNTFKAKRIGPALSAATHHGLHVTSALLFGPLTPGERPTAPYAPVDHYRVIDAQSCDNPEELLPVLLRILGVLNQRTYEFVSLSVGPALAIDDDEVHVWTAMLDTVFARGRLKRPCGGLATALRECEREVLTAISEKSSIGMARATAKKVLRSWSERWDRDRLLRL